MSSLSKLSFVDATPARRSVEDNPVMKFIHAVENQIAAAEAHLKGEVYTVESIRYVGEGDARKKEVYQRPLRTWFAQIENGDWFIAVRYGNRPLRITDDGKHAVLCKKFDNVIPTLKVLQHAAKQGELDEAIAAAHKAGARKNK